MVSFHLPLLKVYGKAVFRHSSLHHHLFLSSCLTPFYFLYGFQRSPSLSFFSFFFFEAGFLSVTSLTVLELTL